MGNLEKMAKFLAETNKKYKKQYNADILYFGNQVGNFAPFKTGFPTFDWINSGIGGFPRGGMTLIHGLESCGKSTFVLESIKFAMKVDETLTVLYIDVENALTESFLQSKGIDTERFTLSPLNTETALNIAESALKENVYDIIVIDSFAKMESEKILEKDLGESAQRNRRAKIITEFLCRITFTLRQSNTALVCINQEIENQNKKTPYDPDTVIPCGKQQLFSANLRIHMKRSRAIKDADGTKKGYLVSLMSAKCKISARERAMTYLTYLYDRGFVREFSLLDYLEMIGYIKKLPQKRFEFAKKELYANPFKAGEIIKIVDQIKEDLGIDLYDIEPDSEIQFEKGESSTEPKTADDGVEDTDDSAIPLDEDE